jgi:hypothetical protein
MAAATDTARAFRGVLTIGAERARELRRSATPVCAGDLVARSGEFNAGDWLYVTSRGHDGGQSVLATGVALVDAARIDALDPQARVIEQLQLLWRSATSEG